MVSSRFSVDVWSWLSDSVRVREILKMVPIKKSSYTFCRSITKIVGLSTRVEKRSYLSCVLLVPFNFRLIIYNYEFFF